MGDKANRMIEKLESDYEKIASKDAWEPKDIEMMKNLQKLMYYIEVRCAMKDGEDYPGSEYIDGRGSMDSRSYSNGMPSRGQMGRFTSGNYYSGGSNRMGRSGHYPMGNGPWYYDSERENAIYELRRMMDTKSDPELKTHLQNVIRDLEQK